MKWQASSSCALETLKVPMELGPPPLFELDAMVQLLRTSNPIVEKLQNLLKLILSMTERVSKSADIQRRHVIVADIPFLEEYSSPYVNL